MLCQIGINAFGETYSPILQEKIYKTFNKSDKNNTSFQLLRVFLSPILYVDIIIIIIIIIIMIIIISPT